MRNAVRYYQLVLVNKKEYRDEVNYLNTGAGWA